MSVAHLAQRRWEVWPRRKGSGGGVVDADDVDDAADRASEDDVLSVLEESAEEAESVLVWRRRKGTEGRR